MKSSFGSDTLIKCLLCLGFKQNKAIGSSHLKFSCSKTVEVGERPFITVILNRKSFDPHTASSFIRQIKQLGYTNTEIDSCLTKKSKR